MNYARHWEEESANDDSGPDVDLIRRKDRGKMPVGKEARARAAGKETWRSRAISRKLGRQTDGMRNRRIKRVV